MTLTSQDVRPLSGAMARPSAALTLAPGPARALLVVAVVAGALGGAAATGPHAATAAIRAAGPELARLLRAMAALKVLMAAPLMAAVAWRLGSVVSPGRLVADAAACAAMAVGPGLIWSLAQVKLGALLLHGGLLATVVLLWRDPAVRERLSAAIAARRTVLARRVRTAPRPSAGR
jgi:hypothetical protein